MIFFRHNSDILYLNKGIYFMHLENLIIDNNFENKREFVLRPLKHKGFNKHFFNLVNADVFLPKKPFSLFKNIFKNKQ